MPCDPGQIASTGRGEWRKAPLAESFTNKIGDFVVQDGTTLKLIRNGQVVLTREALDEQSSPWVPQPLQEVHTFEEVIYFRSNPMQGVTATLVNVTQNQTTGEIAAFFSDGAQLTFADWATFTGEAAVMDSDPATAQKLLLCKLYRATPDGSNLDALNGANCTIDGSSSAIVSFSGTPA